MNGTESILSVQGAACLISTGVLDSTRSGTVDCTWNVEGRSIIRGEVRFLDESG